MVPYIPDIRVLLLIWNFPVQLELENGLDFWCRKKQCMALIQEINLRDKKRSREFRAINELDLESVIHLNLQVCMDILFFPLNLEVFKVCCFFFFSLSGKATPNQGHYYRLEFLANFSLVWQVKLFSIKLTKLDTGWKHSWQTHFPSSLKL